MILPPQPVPHHDVLCPMLTQLGVIGTTYLSIPKQVPYLYADPKRVSFSFNRPNRPAARFQA